MPSLTAAILTLALFTTLTHALPTPQLAGEGAAANSLLSSTDNGIGYGSEDALDNTAGLISSLKAPLPAGGVKARQLDKTSKGAQTLSDALGTGAATSSVTDGLVNLDGTLTGGAASAGDSVGQTESGTLQDVGGSVPSSA